PGLCGSCQHARIVQSSQGSNFYLCLLSRTDARFARYPVLPVRSCIGYNPQPPGHASTEIPVSLDSFMRARDFLLRYRTDYETAIHGFRWPALDTFNWAIDYFDAMVEGKRRRALWLSGED